MDERRSNENAFFREHLDGFFGAASTDDDESDIDSPMEIQEQLQGIDTEGLEEGRKEHYATEIDLLRRAMTLTPQVSPDDAKEIESLMKKMVDAMNRCERDAARSNGSELEDLLYYLEDSI